MHDAAHREPHLFQGAGLAVLHFLRSLPELYGRPQTATAYVAQLDGLRALAILLVLVWHGSLRVVRHVDGLRRGGTPLADVYHFLPHGEIGVALFFLLSGIVIATPFLGRSPRDWRVGIFYWRRLHRLYPPYIVALVLSLLPTLLGVWHDRNVHQIPFFSSFVANVLYLNGLIFNYPSRFNPPSWSLEIEVQFYLLCPLLMLAYVAPRSFRTRALIGFGTAAMLVVAAGALHGVVPFDGRFRFGLLAHLHLFIIGIVVADRARQPRSFPKTVGQRGDAMFAFGLALLLGLGIWLTQVNANPPGMLPYITTQVALVVAVLCLYEGVLCGAVASWMLSRRWPCLIGAMCYSIYLVHIIAIEAISQVLALLPLHQAWLLWPIWAAVLTVGIAVASLAFYIAVERPFMNRPGRRASSVTAVQA